MKSLNIFIAIIIITSFLGCEDKDCVDLNDQNQVKVCENEILLIRQGIDNDGVSNSFFERLETPFSQPLDFQNIRTDPNESGFPEFVRPANYDAFNPNTRDYIIVYPQQETLYVYNADSGSRLGFDANLYAAPVYYNNTFYALRFEASTEGFPEQTVNYEIIEVNSSDGSTNIVFAGNFNRVSPFNIENLSSAKDAIGNIYFLGFSNLIKYNVNNNTADYFELTPNWNSIDNRTRFSGLEFRSNGNLVAIKQYSDTSTNISTITEFSSDNPVDTQLDLINLDIAGINFNPEFYSSTYDKCDDSYYVTYRDSFIFNINLSDSTILGDVNAPYLIGLEAINQ